MIKSLLGIVVGSAVYGFTIGAVHSHRQAARNLVKFPLLILATSLICGLAYCVFAKFLTRRLSLADVVRLSLRTFRDTAVLLASLGPVAYFLALTIAQPTERSLGEYPMFLGLNVGFIALCGTAALVRQAGRLVRQHGLSPRRSAAVALVWLAISLFAGGQCAWYMRPFFGPSTEVELPFMERRNPDYRGAASFYEAVYHLVDPPPLPEAYNQRTRQRPTF